MAFLRAFGICLPSRVMDNVELGAAVGAQPGWILRATGISERRFAAADESVVSLGVGAAKNCLQDAGVSARDIGMIIVATGSAERRFPGPAAAIGAGLGLQGVPCVDLPIASAGSLFGLAMAARLTADYQNILVIGSEVMSRVVRLHERCRDTAILFGDGAGACLVSAHTGFAEIRDSLLASDGDFGESLRLDLDGPLTMDGRTIIMQASRRIPRVIVELIERHQLKPTDVEVFLVHQANLNLLTRVARTLGVPESRFFCNLQRYGNTSSASVLIAAAEWWAATDPRPTGNIVLAAFGAGLHWGAVWATL